MSAGARAVLISIWVLAIGLAAVYLEVEEIRTGARVRQLLLERDARLEEVRQLELRYNLMLSPDLLEKELPEEFVPSDQEEDSPEESRRLELVSGD